MLVSDGGTLIRVPVDGIRFASRTSKGVRIFNTAASEKVVSVEHIPDAGEADTPSPEDTDNSDDPGSAAEGPEGNE
jgi:DNA gyrase subunit A